MRAISIILAFAIAFALTACNQNEPEGTVGLLSATSGTTFEGVTISLSGINRTAADTTLYITWENKTDYSVLYGEAFIIQMLKNGQWEPLKPAENTGFISIGYSLEPGAVATKGHNTAWIYGILQPGTYRFVTSCYVYENKAGNDCELWVEFTLGTLPDGTINTDISQSETVYKTPPVLTLWQGSASKEYPAAGYAWYYATGDGNMAAAHAEMPHPLLCKDTLVKIETTQPEAYIDFEQWPDDITIRCWPDSQFGNTDAESEAVMTWNTNRFTLKPSVDGGYVYEITCSWNGNGRLYHGTATYYLYIASYPVMPIQPRQ